MIKKILPYIIGLSLMVAPALAANIKYSQLTDGGTIKTTDKFPVLRTLAVTGAADNGSGLIRLTTASMTGLGIATNDLLSVSGVGGTVEANAQWAVTVINSTHLDLQGSTFVHAYTSGGQLNFNPSIAVNTLATLAAAPAGTLTGATLASGVTASSLTSTGTLTGGATGAGFTVAIGSSTITGTLPAANNETNLRHTSIGASFSGGGSAIAANSKQWVYVPYGTTIQSWTIACDQSGSIAFDVQMDTYANFSTSMTSIAGTDFPTITSAQKAQDLVLTGWGTTAIPAGDYILFKVTSATTVTNCNIVLDTIRT